MRQIRRFLGLFLSVASLILLGACAFVPRELESPIPSRAYGDMVAAEEAFVLLPGLFDSIQSFEHSGFVPFSMEASSGKRDAVFIAVDAHLGYYKGRVIHERLKNEILPSLAGKRVTAVGVSLGGFGALVTARRYPELIDRIVLVAPFLGWPDFINDIKQNPNAPLRDEVDAEFHAVWAWLRDGADGIPVTILYGEEDNFRIAYEHLATVAPYVRFRGIEGGHDWRTWNSLWASWLTEDLAKPETLAQRPASLEPER